jgi:hypothetical protein
MKKGCLTALGVVTGLLIASIVLIWIRSHPVSVRYRLTVEVQDEDRIQTGSSVIEVSYPMEDMFVDAHPDVRSSGYAPTVNLGEKGLLFLSFSNPSRTPAQWKERSDLMHCGYRDIGCMPFVAYKLTRLTVSSESSFHNQRKDALAELLRQSGPREVPFAFLPTLLRVRDIDDLPMHASRFGNAPRRLVGVSPDDLAASFGPGVELKRVVLELTDDPVTPLPEIWPQSLKELPKEKRELLAVDIGHF